MPCVVPAEATGRAPGRKSGPWVRAAPRFPPPSQIGDDPDRKAGFRDFRAGVAASSRRSPAKRSGAFGHAGAGGGDPGGAVSGSARVIREPSAKLDARRMAVGHLPQPAVPVSGGSVSGPGHPDRKTGLWFAAAAECGTGLASIPVQGGGRTSGRCGMCSPNIMRSGGAFPPARAEGNAGGWIVGFGGLTSSGVFLKPVWHGRLP